MSLNTVSTIKTRREGLEDLYKELCLRNHTRPHLAMCALIQSMPSIREWDLRRILLGEESFGPIIQLINLAPVCTLEMTDCNLPMGVSETLLGSLRSHRHLTALNMRGNVLSKASFRLLLELVSTNKNVLHVNIDPVPMCSLAKVEYLCKLNQTRAAEIAGKMTLPTLLALPGFPPGQLRCVTCNGDVNATPRDHAGWLLAAIDSLLPKFGKHDLPIVWMILRVMAMRTLTPGLCSCSDICAKAWVAKVATEYSTHWDATLRLMVHSEGTVHRPLPCLWSGTVGTSCSVGVIVKSLIRELQRSSAFLTSEELVLYFDFVVGRMFANRSDVALLPAKGISSLYDITSSTLNITLSTEKCCRKAMKCALFDTVGFPCELVPIGTQAQMGGPNTRPHRRLTRPAISVLGECMRTDLDDESLDRNIDSKVSGWGCELETIVKACKEGLTLRQSSNVKYRPSAVRTFSSSQEIALQLQRAADFRNETKPVLGLKLRLEWVQRVKAKDSDLPVLPYYSGSCGCGVLGVVESYTSGVFMVTVHGARISLTEDYVQECVIKYGAVSFAFTETPSYTQSLVITPVLADFSYVLNNLSHVEMALLLIASLPQYGSTTTAYIKRSFGPWAYAHRHLVGDVDITQWPHLMLKSALHALRQRSYGKLLVWFKALSPKQLALVTRLSTQCFANKVVLPYMDPEAQPADLHCDTQPKLQARRREIHALEVQAVNTNVHHSWDHETNTCIIHFAQQRENSNPAYGPGSYFGLEFATPVAVCDIQLFHSAEVGLPNVPGVPWMHRCEWEVSFSDNGQDFRSVRAGPGPSGATRIGFCGAHLFWRIRFVPYDKEGHYISKPIGAPKMTTARFCCVDTDAMLCQRRVLWCSPKKDYMFFGGDRWSLLTGPPTDIKMSSDLWNAFEGGVHGICCAIALNNEVVLVLTQQLVYYVCRQTWSFLQCPTLRTKDEYICRLPPPFCRTIEAALPLNNAGSTLLFAGGLCVVVNILTGKVTCPVRPLTTIGVPFTFVEYAFYPMGENETSMASHKFVAVHGQRAVLVSLDSEGRGTSQPYTQIPTTTLRMLDTELIQSSDLALDGYEGVTPCDVKHKISTNGTTQIMGMKFAICAKAIPYAQYEFQAAVRMVGIVIQTKTYSGASIRVKYSLDEGESWVPISVIQLRPGVTTAWWPEAPSCRQWRLQWTAPVESEPMELKSIMWLSDMRVAMPLRSVDETLSLVVPSHAGKDCQEFAFPQSTFVSGLTLYGSTQRVRIDAFDGQSWSSMGSFDVTTGSTQWPLRAVSRMRITPLSGDLMPHVQWRTMPTVELHGSEKIRCFVKIRFTVRGQPVLWEVIRHHQGTRYVVAQVAQSDIEAEVSVSWYPQFGDEWEVRTSTNDTVSPALQWFGPLSPSVVAVASQGRSLDVKFGTSVPRAYSHVSCGVVVEASGPSPFVVNQRGQSLVLHTGESKWSPRPSSNVSVHFTGRLGTRFERVTWLEPRFPSNTAVVDYTCFHVSADDFNKKVVIDAPVIPAGNILIPGKTLTFTGKHVPMVSTGLDIMWTGCLPEVAVLDVCNERDVVANIVLRGENGSHSVSWKPEGAHRVWRVKCISVGPGFEANDVMLEFQWHVALHSVPCLSPTSGAGCAVTSNLPGWEDRPTLPIKWFSNVSAKSGAFTFLSFDYRTSAREHTRIKIFFKSSKPVSPENSLCLAIEGSHNAMKWTTVKVHEQQGQDCATSEWHSFGHFRYWRLVAVASFEGELQKVQWFGVNASSLSNQVASWSVLAGRELLREAVRKRPVQRPSLKRPADLSTFDRMYSALGSGGSLLQDILSSVDTSVNNDLSLLGEKIGVLSLKNSQVISSQSTESGLPVLSIDGELFDGILDGTVPAGTPTRLALHWDAHSHDMASHSMVAMVVFDLPIDLIALVCARLDVTWAAPAKAAIQDRGLVVISTGDFKFSDTHTYPILVPPSNRWKIRSDGPYMITRGVNVINHGEITTLELLEFEPRELTLLQVVNDEGLQIAFQSQRTLSSLFIDRVVSTSSQVSSAIRISSSQMRWRPTPYDLDIMFVAALKWDGQHQSYALGGSSTDTVQVPFGWQGTHASSFEIFADVHALAEGFDVRNLRVQCTVWFSDQCPISCSILQGDSPDTQIRAVKLSSPHLLHETVRAFLRPAVGACALAWLPEDTEFHCMEATMSPEDPSRTLWLKSAVRMLGITTRCEGFLDLQTSTVVWRSMEPTRVVRIGETLRLENCSWAYDSRQALTLRGLYTFLGTPCFATVSMGDRGTEMEFQMEFVESHVPPVVVRGSAVGHATTVADWDFSVVISADLSAEMEKALRAMPFLSAHSVHVHPQMSFYVLPFGYAAPQSCPILGCSGNFYGFPFDVFTPLCVSLHRMVEALECLIGKMCFGMLV